MTFNPRFSSGPSVRGDGADCLLAQIPDEQAPTLDEEPLTA